MKNKEQIKQDWDDIMQKGIEAICDALRSYEYDIQEHLCLFVASLCDVNKREMMSSNRLYLAQARWLYWYAYRYMTHKTSEEISQRTSHEGRHYSISCISNSISKMDSLIEHDETWRERWSVVKMVIKAKSPIEKNNIIELGDKRICISIPQELKKVVKFVETK